MSLCLLFYQQTKTFSKFLRFMFISLNECKTYRCVYYCKYRTDFGKLISNCKLTAYIFV